MATRCFSPPESWWGKLCILCARSTRLQQFPGLGRRLSVPVQFRREHDILKSGQGRDQVKGLKDIADGLVAKRCKFILAQVGDIGAGKNDPAGIRPVQARQKAQQG